VVFEKR